MLSNESSPLSITIFTCESSEYFIPFIFSKQINSNFRVYGTAILSLVQYNYTDISNYFIDGNNTKTNISYTNKFDQTSNDLILVKDEAPHVNLHLIGKYRGYEYGYKITASYDLKYYSLFLTSYTNKFSTFFLSFIVSFSFNKI